jgi:hypothetical protein
MRSFSDCTIMRQTAYPLEIHLADGVARAVPQATRAGVPSYAIGDVARPDLDPTIPRDLVAAGWFWQGSWLMRTGQGMTLAITCAGCCLDDVWAAARERQQKQ